ncbi:hypothetical protein RND71_038988 [Anisodus tanguticus]|uniref:Uncharacterized protein n=1 Tax=Anisodus tanguticus TaxID=243964 RepID=A0AAE1R3Q7_9SOLA|nr:hypothetical protein RND71_038988 [Anisodus tanguticus]
MAKIVMKSALFVALLLITMVADIPSFKVEAIHECDNPKDCEPRCPRTLAPVCVFHRCICWAKNKMEVATTQGVINPKN